MEYIEGLPLYRSATSDGQRPDAYASSANLRAVSDSHGPVIHHSIAVNVLSRERTPSF